jgi:hypothetical protein
MGWHVGLDKDYTNTMRDSDTGEHISNKYNELQYIPFPICNETGKPLELQYTNSVTDGMPSLLISHHPLPNPSHTAVKFISSSSMTPNPKGR